MRTQRVFIIRSFAPVKIGAREFNGISRLVRELLGILVSAITYQVLVSKHMEIKMENGDQTLGPSFSIDLVTPILSP